MNFHTWSFMIIHISRQILATVFWNVECSLTFLMDVWKILKFGCIMFPDYIFVRYVSLCIGKNICTIAMKPLSFKDMMPLLISDMIIFMTIFFLRSHTQNNHSWCFPQFHFSYFKKLWTHYLTLYFIFFLHLHSSYLTKY